MKCLTQSSSWLLILRPMVVASFVLRPSYCHLYTNDKNNNNQGQSSSRLYWRRPWSSSSSAAADITTTTTTSLSESLSSAANNSTSAAAAATSTLLPMDSDSDDTTTIEASPNSFSRTLNFQCAFEALSDPLLVLPDLDDDSRKNNKNKLDCLASFFDDPSHFSFGPSLPSTIVPITPELRHEWIQACEMAGATLPSKEEDGDGQHIQRIISVRAAGFSMLGLTIEWSALMGAQVLVATSTTPQKRSNGENNGLQPPPSQLPCLEFVLIKDQSTARGSNKLFLWMYNKITGNTAENNNGSKAASSKPQRKTIFSSRFGFVEQQDEQQQLAFECKGVMEMLFPVPSIVGRALGLPESPKLQKLQQKVNKIITGEIEKDMKKAISHWEDNFRKWALQVTEK